MPHMSRGGSRKRGRRGASGRDVASSGNSMSYQGASVSLGVGDWKGFMDMKAAGAFDGMSADEYKDMLLSVVSSDDDVVSDVFESDRAFAYCSCTGMSTSNPRNRLTWKKADGTIAYPRQDNWGENLYYHFSPVVIDKETGERQDMSAVNAAIDERDFLTRSISHALQDRDEALRDIKRKSDAEHRNHVNSVKAEAAATAGKAFDDGFAEYRDLNLSGSDDDVLSDFEAYRLSKRIADNDEAKRAKLRERYPRASEDKIESWVEASRVEAYASKKFGIPRGKVSLIADPGKPASVGQLAEWLRKGEYADYVMKSGEYDEKALVPYMKKACDNDPVTPRARYSALRAYQQDKRVELITKDMILDQTINDQVRMSSDVIGKYDGFIDECSERKAEVQKSLDEFSERYGLGTLLDEYPQWDDFITSAVSRLKKLGHAR